MNFMKKLIVLFLWVAAVLQVQAAKVDTVSVFSERMEKDVKVLFISPEKGTPQSTLYLLHGYSGNYSSWINLAPQIKDWVDKNQYLVVCPDGGFDSWYWDTESTNYFYETFITKELLPYAESKYGAPVDRMHRGITGLSMGGHGALYLAFRHQDLFACAGSTSGGVDIRPFPNNWNMKKHLGEYRENVDVWDSHTVMELTHLIQPGSLKLFIDCGTEDFFFRVNEKLHEKLTYMNVPHHYQTMPGKHDGQYWSKSIDYQMAFFHQCFAAASTKK